jgi:hypothetical protein
MPPTAQLPDLLFCPRGESVLVNMTALQVANLDYVNFNAYLQLLMSPGTLVDGSQYLPTVHDRPMRM